MSRRISLVPLVVAIIVAAFSFSLLIDTRSEAHPLAEPPIRSCGGYLNGSLCMTDAKVQSRLTETVLAHRASEVRRTAYAAPEAPEPKPQPTKVSPPKPKPKPVRQVETSRQIDRAPARWSVVSKVWAKYPAWVGRFALCVANHESMHSGLWTAQNPYSSASGFAQWVRGTWEAHSRAAGFPGYSQAKYAPPYVQAHVFAKAVTTFGPGAWKGTHCGYGT